ncbi:hypothetical protein LEMLEM_LOCUS15919, partial [Lemmus lemmus]
MEPLPHTSSKTPASLRKRRLKGPELANGCKEP